MSTMNTKSQLRFNFTELFLSFFNDEADLYLVLHKDYQYFQRKYFTQSSDVFDISSRVMIYGKNKNIGCFQVATLVSDFNKGYPDDFVEIADIIYNVRDNNEKIIKSEKVGVIAYLNKSKAKFVIIVNDDRYLADRDNRLYLACYDINDTRTHFHYGYLQLINNLDDEDFDTFYSYVFTKLKSLKYTTITKKVMQNGDSVVSFFENLYHLDY